MALLTEALTFSYKNQNLSGFMKT